MTRPNPRTQISRHCSSAYGHREASGYPNKNLPPLQARMRPVTATLHKPQSTPARTATRPRQPQPSPGTAAHTSRQPQPSPIRRRKVQRQPRSRKVWLAGSGMLALAALVVVPKPGTEEPQPVSNACEQKVASQSVLSRAELSELLTVPEGSPQDTVQTLVSEPYCTLAPIALSEGTTTERAAYPLEFDPQTWLIVRYKNNEYAGFDFSFRRE
ncbi:MAG: hypothetical protein AAFX01_06730 [Cyanobacteria bacterium J06638_28]